MRQVHLIPYIAVFEAVVKNGGFRNAAKELDVSKATISRQVGLLEEALGTRLLDRSTRALHPTHEGQLLLEEFRAVQDAWHTLLDHLSQSQEAISGRLRITAPLAVTHRLLMPTVERFASLHPRAQVDLLPSDRLLDLVSEHIDVAIRSGPLPDSSYVATPLLETREVVVGTPACIQSLPHPEEPDLNEATWVTNALLPLGSEIKLYGEDDALQNLHPKTVFRAYSSDTHISMVLQGLGLGLIPQAFIARELAAGDLQALPWKGRDITLYALFLERRLAPPRVRSFLKALREDFQALTSATDT